MVLSGGSGARCVGGSTRPRRARYRAQVPAPRYRCTSCGNLTRFDVTSTTRVRAFHHYTVGGELSVEEPQVLEERVEEVLCRWCGSGAAVEPLGAAIEGAVPGG